MEGKALCLLFFVLGSTSAISTISVAAYVKGYIALAPAQANYAAGEERTAYYPEMREKRTRP